MQTEFPFTVAFGDVSNRKRCIESSERLYWRLLSTQKEQEFLLFQTLCETISDKEATDQAKVKKLIALFRPDKDGRLDELDFVRSIDGVYRDLRFLVSSIQNATQIERAYEKIINCIFYAMVFCLSLEILGVDALAFVLSLSSLIVAFAFMIGSACAQFFEVRVTPGRCAMSCR